jgi:uncharacterized protein (UPF0332 family)
MENRLLDLSKYRMDKAKDDLDTSEIMFKNNKYSQSINRSYYAMFHAVRSLLALSNFDSQKHSGIISYFNHHYIKSGKIEIEYSKMLTTAFKIRSDSDYKDFYVITRHDAELQLKNARKFVKKIQAYLEKLES